MLKYSLGIDVSKKDLHACLSVIDAVQQVKVQATRKFTNPASRIQGVTFMDKQTSKANRNSLIVVMESTGVHYV
jgi:transposase